MTARDTHATPTSSANDCAAELESLSGRAVEALHAVGIGEPGGSRFGRKLDYWVAPARDEETGKSFASFGIRHPHLIFRIEPEQARALANELTEIADSFDRWNRE